MLFRFISVRLNKTQLVDHESHIAFLGNGGSCVAVLYNLDFQSLSRNGIQRILIAYCRFYYLFVNRDIDVFVIGYGDCWIEYMLTGSLVFT